jgi:hypothetical protein
MIHALRYEPQGQRQRFEPHDEPRGDRWHKHMHLHLSFPMRQGRFSPLSVKRLLQIFEALVGATATVAWLTDSLPMSPAPSTLLNTSASHLIFASLVLAWGAVVLGGLPLLVSAWRRSLRVRFLLVLPLILVLPFIAPLTIPIILLVNRLAFEILLLLGLTPWGPSLGPSLLVLFVYPLISAIVLNRAFHRVELSSTALRFGSLLSFVVVGAMVLLLLGEFLFCLSFVLAALTPWSAWLLPLFGMCLAVLVAVHALLWRPRSRERAQARPRDASPSDFDSFQEPRGDRG